MIARTLRGLAALVVVTVGLVGWPIALITAGRAAGPWLPDLTDPLGLLARPDSGGLFLALILALGAVAWLVWSIALLVEVAAQARGVPTPRLGGLFPQHSAAALVTTIAIAFSITPTPVLAGPVTTTGPARPANTASQAADPQQEAAGHHTSDEGSAHGYTVIPGDTLWDIADEQLDDPYRWSEIAEASEQITQPDGQHLADPDLIHPGWTLHLPAPAAAATPPAEPPAAPAEPQPDQQAAGASEIDPPDTPLRPTAARTTRGGSDRATTASVSARVEDWLPATPMHPAAGADEGTRPWHGVPGLPDWVRPPFKPTPLADAPDVHEAVLAVLAQRGAP
ncbi:MAG: LysM peptidoglycan-binding domain-containing protein [Candidatus Nanopelagicales bacterium]